MQFVPFVFACIITTQVTYVSALQTEAKPVREKNASELHNEFTKLGTQMQANLKRARSREDLKGDTHIQAALNYLEEAHKTLEEEMTKLMDPKHTLSQIEEKQWSNDYPALFAKYEAEKHLLRPEQRQDQLLRQIESNSIDRFIVYGYLIIKKIQN